MRAKIVSATTAQLTKSMRARDYVEQEEAEQQHRYEHATRPQPRWWDGERHLLRLVFCEGHGHLELQWVPVGWP